MTATTIAPPQSNWVDRHWDKLMIASVAVIIVIVVLPLLFVVNASISDPDAVAEGGVLLWPVNPTLEGFRAVFENPEIWIGYRNTIVYTVLGVAIHLAVTLPAAYALSRAELFGRRVITWFFLVTMFFTGGLIPLYLVVKDLGMLNTIWAIVIPGVVNVWSLLVGQAFFRSTVPKDLSDAAKVDGAGHFAVFMRIAIPLSLPIIATLALFHAVGLWNGYFNAMIFLQDRELYPLQLFLREILIVNQAGDVASQGAGSTESMTEQVRMASLIKYAVMIVSAVPLLVVYPFLQRFFVKGTLIGATKE